MENFDCTQFISFDYLKKDADIVDVITKKMEKIGFETLQGEQIRSVKGEFFCEQKRGFFLELKNEEFLGEFYQWKIENNPPLKITEFKDVIEESLGKYDISNLKLFFTYFAEEESSTEVFEVGRDRIMQGLFFVTPNNFDKWADNYVMKIM